MTHDPGQTTCTGLIYSLQYSYYVWTYLSMNAWCFVSTQTIISMLSFVVSYCDWQLIYQLQAYVVLIIIDRQAMRWNTVHNKMHDLLSVNKSSLVGRSRWKPVRFTGSHTVWTLFDRTMWVFDIFHTEFICRCQIRYCLFGLLPNKQMLNLLYVLHLLYV